MTEEAYTHMAVIPVDDTDDHTPDMPKRMTPSFSLAYLRECTDGAALCNKEGRISFLNDAAIALFRLRAPEDASGKSWWEVWPDEMEAVLRDAHQRTLGGEAVRFTTFLGDGEGDANRWDILTSPVVDSDGKIDAVFNIIMPAELG